LVLSETPSYPISTPWLAIRRLYRPLTQILILINDGNNKRKQSLKREKLRNENYKYVGVGVRLVYCANRISTSYFLTHSSSIKIKSRKNYYDYRCGCTHGNQINQVRQSGPYLQAVLFPFYKNFYFNSNSIFPNNFISVSNFHFTENS